ncbi:uncharacterized protein LOC134176610 isoform X2 [Corticium candelabrum]|uniref:uncharacterized protein LOC134176610 isoform X2 n=1 Tax=Corticium candelabrum TaxID=121492 RepID=UPI002E262043|nr:uncharacterized protein LOC134176610 isoform X2 [Corticium candelabrum]
MSDEYERYVTRNIVELVETLRPSLLLEHSVASNLVTMQEARKLRQCSTEQDSARMLLYDILPYKENAVDRFCEVLKQADQSHIARDVMKRGGVVCTDECASNLQTGRQHITREVMGKEDVVESAKWSIKVSVSGHVRGKSDVSSSPRPSVSAARDGGTTARDFDLVGDAAGNCITVSEGEHNLLGEALGCVSRDIQSDVKQVEIAGEQPEPWPRPSHITYHTHPLVSDIEDDDDPWPALRHNYVFLSKRLRCNSFFLGCLYEKNLISNDDFDTLSRDSLSHVEKIRRLIVGILPSKPPEMFDTFCDILCCVGQSHVANRLMQDPQRVRLLAQGASRKSEKESFQRRVEMLLVQVADLDREKREAVKRAAAAEAQAQEARRETEEAREEAQEAREEAEKANRRAVTAEVKMRGEELTNMAFRTKLLSADEINDSLPSWTQWNVHIPHDPRMNEYNRMGEIEGRLVVGGRDGNLHVLTYEHDKWDKFVRKNGIIMNVVCHQGVCLVCVKDGDKDQLVIEQFHLNEDKKWRFLTVLPNELQLYHVSVALHDNSLYVVGGETKSWKRVNTARVCDLHSGHWYKMDDMQTKHCSCSSVIINNTVFVGGGETGRYSSNIVECADVRDRKWRTIPSTTTYWPTLTSVSNRLVGTGGETQQQMCYSPSNIVELYDERSTKWLPLPLMTHKRVEHAAFSTQNGELITAGGLGCDYSIESLKCD